MWEEKSSDPSSGMKRHLSLPDARSTDSCTEQSARNAAGGAEWTSLWNHTQRLRRYWVWCGICGRPLTGFHIVAFFCFPRQYLESGMRRRGRSAPPFLQHKVQCAFLSPCQRCHQPPFPLPHFTIMWQTHSVTLATVKILVLTKGESGGDSHYSIVNYIEHFLYWVPLLVSKYFMKAFNMAGLNFLRAQGQNWAAGPLLSLPLLPLSATCTVFCICQDIRGPWL